MINYRNASGAWDPTAGKALTQVYTEQNKKSVQAEHSRKTSVWHDADVNSVPWAQLTEEQNQLEWEAIARACDKENRR